MKRYALPTSYAYAIYVFVNQLLFVMKHHDSMDRGGLSFMVVYATVALGVSIGSAVLITHRREHLS